MFCIQINLKTYVYIRFFRTSISYNSSQSDTINKISKKSKLRFKKSIETNTYDFIKNSQEYFDKGILFMEDDNFIKAKNLKPYDIAKFSDPHHSSLSNIDIFKIYDTKQVNYHFKKILYFSLINKNKSNYFHSLYYHPGNILTMIKYYRGDKEFKKAIRSFQKFIELSMFDLKLKEQI